MPASKPLAFRQQIEHLTAAFASDLVGIMKAAIVESVTSAVADVPSAPERVVKAAVTVSPKLVAKARKTAAKKLPVVAKRRAKGAKRSRAVIARTTAALLAEIVAHPGQRIEQIAKALKIATRDLELPTKKLLAGGTIKATGVKRATSYSPA
jgi:hypothetical protein